MTAPAVLLDADRHVLERLIAGRTVQQIARETYVSQSAVAMRLLRLRERYGAESNVQLVADLIRKGQV